MSQLPDHCQSLDALYNQIQHCLNSTTRSSRCRELEAAIRITTEACQRQQQVKEREHSGSDGTSRYTHRAR